MAKISDFVANFNNEGEFNYSVHIAEEFSFIYFSNPKTACTMAKASINISFANALGLRHSFKGIGEIHNRKYNILKGPHELGYDKFLAMIADEGVTKLCFTRNPFSRVASAYASKIGDKGPIADKIRRKFDVSADADLRQEVPFRLFAEKLSVDPDFRDCDEHWRLQRKQICFDLVPDLFIGRQETASDDLMRVLRRTFGDENVQIFDVRKNFPQNLSNSKALIAAASEETVNYIRRGYADDYSFIGE